MRKNILFVVAVFYCFFYSCNKKPDQASSYTITGQVLCANSEPVPNAQVICYLNNFDVHAIVFADADGFYSLEAPSTIPILIKAFYENTNYIIDDEDIELWEDILFGIAESSPLNFFLGDVNGDGVMSTFDKIIMVEIQNGIYDTALEWKMVPLDVIVGSRSFDEAYQFDFLTNDVSDVHFLALMPGDFNESDCLP